MKKQIIFILGMHRSGTSALTRMVNLLGAILGKDLLPAQQNINERGFWEHNKLLEINERILGSLNRRWYDIEPMPTNWANDKRLAGYRSSIRSFVEDHFSQYALSAIKDPRLCTLLPIWKNALKGCELNIKAILMLRNPHEVAASICKRDPLGITTAYLLWAIHTRDAEIGSREFSRSVVSYDQLLTDWHAVAEKIANDADIHWPEPIKEVEQTIQSEIDPELKHQTRQTHESGSQIADLCQRIYDTHLDNNSPIDTVAMDVLWKELTQYLSNAAEPLKALSDTNRSMIDQLPEKLVLGEEINSLRQVLSERESTLDKTQLQLAALGLQNQHNLDTLAQRDQQLNDLGEHHQYALEIVAKRDDTLLLLAEELQQLKATFAVRITNKLSRLAGKK